MFPGFNNSLTPEDKFQRGIIQLQMERPFFAVIIMRMWSRSTKDTSMPTMAVNEVGDLFWNETFVDELTEDGLLFVLAHEALHPAKGDLYRRGERDPLIWNIATDAIINHILVKEEMTPPVWTQKLLDMMNESSIEGMEKEKEKKPGDVMGIVPSMYGEVEIAGKFYNVTDKSDEQFYDELLNDAKFISNSMFGDSSSKENSGDGFDQLRGHGGFDCHIKGNKDEKGEPTKNGGENPQDNPTKAANRDKWRKIATEAATVAKQRGTLPGFAESMLTYILQPRVDWKSRIRSFITNEIPHDFHNRFPNRKFYSTGVWQPCLYNENVRLFVSIDCSGSTAPYRDEFVSEVVGIITAHPSVEAKLVCWDTKVSSQNVLDIDTQTVDKLKKLKLQDVSGGTEISAYKNYLDKNHYSCRVHIHLTDGYIESNPKLPPGRHLFVIAPGGSSNILDYYGECIPMNTSDVT